MPIHLFQKYFHIFLKNLRNFPYIIPTIWYLYFIYRGLTLLYCVYFYQYSAIHCTFVIIFLFSNIPANPRPRVQSPRRVAYVTRGSRGAARQTCSLFALAYPHLSLCFALFLPHLKFKYCFTCFSTSFLFLF